MGLIKNDKVKGQAIKHANFFHKRGTEANRQDIQIFECAVQFAETELANLAVEFADWFIKSSFVDEYKIPIDDIKLEFKEFIEQQKK